MSIYNRKILLPTFIVGSIVFAACSLIFMTQGSKTLQVRLDRQDVLNGTVKDTVSPFTAVLFSLGVGLSVYAIVGWKQSLHKSYEMSRTISNLQQLISEKESQIQEMKMSPSQINRSQLDWFLEEREELVTSQSTSSENTSSENTYPLEIALDSVKIEKGDKIKDRNFVVVDAASGFPNVQPVIGLKKDNSSTNTDVPAKTKNYT
ncbi:MAG: hypothetical protein ACFB02_02220 [Mastigocoleus sp.]